MHACKPNLMASKRCFDRRFDKMAKIVPTICNNVNHVSAPHIIEGPAAFNHPRDMFKVTDLKITMPDELLPQSFARNHYRTCRSTDHARKRIWQPANVCRIIPLANGEPYEVVDIHRMTSKSEAMIIPAFRQIGSP